MASSSSGQRVVRRLIELLTLAIIALGFLQGFLLDGLLPALRVDSQSMAPGIVGPHVALACEACRYSFFAEPQRTLVSVRQRCPMCGGILSSSARVMDGDRLLVNRAVFELRAPRRGELALIECPESAQPCLKRIMGLPGETLELRHGDVWIDGQIIRKSLEGWREIRILVHDDQYQGEKGPGMYFWSPSESQTSWSRKAGSWSCNLSGPQSNSPDWIELSDGDARGTQQPRMWDDLVYNVNESRQLNPVSDVSLACRVKLDGNGALLLRGRWRGQEVIAEYKLESKKIELRIDDQAAAQASLSSQRHPSEWELVLIDAQAMVVADGIVLCHSNLDTSQSGHSDETPSPVALAIGAQGNVQIQAEQLQFYRDIYYTAARGMLGPRQLALDEYFVLGDNSSVSRDSRHWPPGTVRRCHLLGKPVKMTMSQ